MNVKYLIKMYLSNKKGEYILCLDNDLKSPSHGLAQVRDTVQMLATPCVNYWRWSGVVGKHRKLKSGISGPWTCVHMDSLSGPQFPSLLSITSSTELFNEHLEWSIQSMPTCETLVRSNTNGADQALLFSHTLLHQNELPPLCVRCRPSSQAFSNTNKLGV